MGGLLLIWLGLLAVLIAFAARPREGGVLVLAYFLGLSLIHVPGLLPFLQPDYVPNAEETQRGFELTLLGMGAFAAGALIGRFSTKRPDLTTFAPPAIFEKFGWRALLVGVFAYFVGLPIASHISSLTAIVSPLGGLLVVGLWLRLYGAVAAERPERTWQTLAMLPILPLATLSTAGFIGYGVYWVLSVVSFLFVITKRRAWFYAAAPVGVFLGLSLFVAYMGQRTGIRELVWNEQATYADRFERIGEIFTNFKPLNLNDPDHVRALEDRLNQNYLVGRGMEEHEIGVSPYLYGGSIPIWSLVPRAVWADKPNVGGGGELVQKFTDLYFGKETSVGAGQVLEFYMNFGPVGVVVGFLAWGFALMRMDFALMRSLQHGDLRRLVTVALPALALLQPGGNLMEIFVSLAAAIISARIVCSMRFFGVRRRPPKGGVVAPGTSMMIRS